MAELGSSWITLGFGDNVDFRLIDAAEDAVYLGAIRPEHSTASMLVDHSAVG